MLLCESGNAEAPFKAELHSPASSFPWASGERPAESEPERDPAGGVGVWGKVISGRLERVGGNGEEVSFTSLNLLS